MITTNYFSFIHMHKTGSQTLAKLLTLTKSSEGICYNYPVSELPKDAKHLPIVGMVRNPWSFTATTI
jgi:hypothetical protein